MSKRIKDNCADCGKYIDVTEVSKPYIPPNLSLPQVDFKTRICKKCFVRRKKEETKKVRTNCHRCFGSGKFMGYVCQVCKGEGTLEKTELATSWLMSIDNVWVCPDW